MARASFTHYITDDSALGGMEIERSLRFDDESDAHLSKTFSSAGNRKVWTWSAWIRRGGTYASTNCMFHAYDGGSSNRAQIAFDNADRLYVHQGGGGGSKGQTRTDRQFRDSNWYHIVCVANFADSTAADRVKMYVNGELQTKTIQVAFTNENGLFNSNIEHEIGAIGSTGNNFDGYMTEINFIDGQALDASYFGYTDFQTGKWRPKRYEGTYGQNGFHLEFKDNSAATTTTIGKDTSGNQHNFAPDNISVSGWENNDSFIDTPTNTFPILSLNTIYRVHNSNSDVYNGGMKYNCHYDNQGSVRAAMNFPTSGKWYFEVKLLTSNGNAAFGICPSTYSMYENSFTTTNTPGAIGYAAYSQYFRNGSASGGVGGWGTSDTVALALDMDEKKITFYKNNSAQITLDLLSGYENIPYFPMLTGGTNGGTVNLGINFGGNESFVYTPPEGFKTLCSRNLPSISPTSIVLNPKKNFHTLTYSGNGSNGHQITGLDFKPDFVWIKVRSTTGSHYLVDSVRGLGTGDSFRALDSVGTSAEYSNDNDMLRTLNHNGFTLDDNTDNTFYVNRSSDTYVAWCWKAGGATVTNNDGTIATQVSANQQAGFSILTWTGTGADGTIGHGLGKVPAFVIIKNRDRSVDFIVKHQNLSTGKVIYLNLEDGEGGATGSNNGIIGDFNNASTFSLSRTSNSGNYNNVNYSGEKFVAYCWSEIPGYSKMGIYTGTGNQGVDGPFIHIGFKPAWILVKRIDSTKGWGIIDTVRSPLNATNNILFPDLNNADYTAGGHELDIVGNGFKIKNNNNRWNTSGGKYIYMVFAEQINSSPFDTETNGR